jgi:nucleotide-binding universal stress UspA family protein
MGITTENVVVAGVDGSTSAAAAALWAAGEAQQRGAALRLIQAYSASVGFAGPGVMVAPDISGAVHHWAQKVLIDARNTIATSYPALEITIELHRGHPLTVLKNASAGVLLTVVGSHGNSQLTESLLGSVAQKVAGQAAGPVIVVRTSEESGTPPAAGPVLVGLDGSAESAGALSFAFEEASLRGVELVAIHSWDNEPRVGSISSYPREQDRARFEEEHRVLAEQLSGWSDKYPDVRVVPLVVRGQAAAAIMGRCGRTVDEQRPSLIVVGSRGRGGFAGLLLGSTSHALIAHAACPVAVVRAVVDQRAALRRPRSGDSAVMGAVTWR